MTEQNGGVPLIVASVSDRGLNEKRPLNEDSFLADERRRIFAVCDGVGGAEAGEVASQTAIEVLDEAFRHHKDGDDIEDLMEIAIQRANTSIHTMSREHPRLSMMATTVVALHLDGRRATIGHVGDSRLYRVAPDGSLHRETADHSVVEEEVRAGRMTPQQAANHPSRNVISRALGAEASVEVDMKTVEAEDGTTFLLCSDGITRHIPDEELSVIINHAPTLEEACAEMKRRCFERGAEDNLTAVLIHVGERQPRASLGNEDDTAQWDEERTILAERPPQAPPQQQASAPAASQEVAAEEVAAAAATSSAPTHLRRPFDGVQTMISSQPLVEREEFPRYAEAPRPAEPPPAPRRSAMRSVLGVLFVLFLLAGVGVLAFFGGTVYHRYAVDAPEEEERSNAAAAPAPTMETPEGAYERRRREVDRDPSGAVRMRTEEMNGEPLTSRNPEFLYLYGRALLLSGRPRDAAIAFDASLARIKEEEMTPENGQLKVEARLAKVAAMMKAGDIEGARAAARDLDDVTRAAEGNPATTGTFQTPAPSPLP